MLYNNHKYETMSVHDRQLFYKVVRKISLEKESSYTWIDEDIEHDLSDLVCDDYGSVVAIYVKDVLFEEDEMIQASWFRLRYKNLKARFESGLFLWFMSDMAP